MVDETLIRDLNYWGNSFRDAAIRLQHLEQDLNMAHRLLEEKADLLPDGDEWKARVDDYLMRI